MALDADTASALETKYTDWQKKLAGEWDDDPPARAGGAAAADARSALRDNAKRAADRAEKLHKQGARRARRTRRCSTRGRTRDATRHATTCSRKVQSGDSKRRDRATSRRSRSSDEATTTVFEKIGAIKPKTLGGHLQMLAAFQAALRAWGFAGVREAVGRAGDRVSRHARRHERVRARLAGGRGVDRRRRSRRRCSSSAQTRTRTSSRSQELEFENGRPRQLHVLDPEREADVDVVPVGAARRRSTTSTSCSLGRARPATAATCAQQRLAMRRAGLPVAHDRHAHPGLGGPAAGPQEGVGREVARVEPARRSPAASSRTTTRRR